MGGHRLGTDKDVEALARKARRAGWDVYVSGKGHLCWTAPDGTSYFTPLTYGDQRRIKRIHKFLRVHGVKI